jgi:hypothetical protein
LRYNGCSSAAGSSAVGVRAGEPHLPFSVVSVVEMVQIVNQLPLPRMKRMFVGGYRPKLLVKITYEKRSSQK